MMHVNDAYQYDVWKYFLMKWIPDRVLLNSVCVEMSPLWTQFKENEMVSKPKTVKFRMCGNVTIMNTVQGEWDWFKIENC